MSAYEAAFKQTRLVARYPAGPDHPRYADNSRRAFGYHDDSFAWATAHTGKESESWFFESLMRAGGRAGEVAPSAHRRRGAAGGLGLPL